MNSRYVFGDFELRPSERQVLIDGAPVALGSRAFDLLMALIERRARVVPVGELFELVWPGRVVEENNIRQQVAALRKALGPNAVLTVPGRGYRFGLEPSAPAGTVSRVSDNLPGSVSPLVGRDDDLSALQAAVPTAPLLTLVGVGGVGKTRLALEVARLLRGRFADGIWLIELGPLADPALVPHSVARATGVHEEADRPIVETLVDAMRRRETLLLLDNCEHLIGACAQLAEQMLRACAGMRILATSREPLAIDGERVWRVPSLRTRDPATVCAPDDLLAFPAERLFVQRATACSPGFCITEKNAPAVAQVCRRLDGIPLALELAAARIRTMRVEQIAARLDDRFALLTQGNRTALPRHQTLRALVEWSHQLLSPAEQTLLRRLAVFSGGWTLESSEVVCTGPDLPSSEVLGLMAQLVDKSLVLLDEISPEPRYRMLETIRQYALEQLVAAGEDAELRTRHLRFAVDFAEGQRRPLVLRDREPRWAEAVDAELENLRAALQWAQQPALAELGLQIVEALHRYWYQSMLWKEMVERVERLLETCAAHGPPTQAQARACYVGGMLATNYDQAAGRQLCERGLATSRSLGFDEGIAKCTMWLAHLDARRRDPATAAMFETSLTLGRSIADPFDRSHFLLLAMVCQAGYEALMHRDEAAETVVAACERENDAFGGVYLFRGHCLALRGTLATRRGDLAQAASLLADSLAFYRAIGSIFDVGGNLVQQGFLALRRGQPRLALQLFKESLPLHGTYTLSPWVTRSLAHLTIALASCQSWHLAARLAGSLGIDGELDPAQATVPTVISGTVADNYRQALAATRSALGVEVFSIELARGSRLSREEAIALAGSAEVAAAG